MSKRSKLDDETIDEIFAYAEGMHIAPIYYEISVIPAGNKSDLRFWLKSKTDFEGTPISGIVDEIGVDGKIERPIIIDLDNSITAEGRHRLAAALKYDLDVPVVMISTHKTKNSRRLT